MKGLLPRKLHQKSGRESSEMAKAKVNAMIDGL